MNYLASDLLKNEYKKLKKNLEIFLNSEVTEKNIYKVLTEEFKIYIKIPIIDERNFKNIIDLVINMYEINENEKLEKIKKINFFINAEEYELYNNFSSKYLNKLSIEEKEILSSIFYLFKKSLFDISMYELKEKENELPIDGLMILKGKKYGNKNDNIIIEEILSSSLGKRKKYTYEQLILLDEKTLLEIHELCIQYMNENFCKNIFNISGNYRQVNTSEKNFLIRRLDVYDCHNGMYDKTKNRFAMNCSLINPDNAHCFPGEIKRCIYGYSNIQDYKILFIYPYDAYTNELKSEEKIYSMSVGNNMLITVDELSYRTKLNNHYNEIVILGNDKNGNKLNPSYILVRDEIDNESDLEAKELDIPLVRIKINKKYQDRDVISKYYTDYYSATN
ncbi:MAG: hypothetical protein R3Y13_03995 [bacterium]